MKTIKFKLCSEINVGTKEEPKIVQDFVDITRTWSEKDEEIAKREAYNGEYTIEDDGQPEPPPTTEQRVSDLEEQLAQSDEIAITLYEAQEAQEVINAQQDEALMEIYEMIG